MSIVQYLLTIFPICKVIYQHVTSLCRLWFSFFFQDSLIRVFPSLDLTSAPLCVVRLFLHTASTAATQWVIVLLFFER